MPLRLRPTLFLETTLEFSSRQMDWPALDLNYREPCAEYHEPTIAFPNGGLSDGTRTAGRHSNDYDHGDSHEHFTAVDESAHSFPSFGDDVLSTGTDLLATGLCNLADVNLDDFLLHSGGWRPPVPCSHCRLMRFQCFMLQTTDANPNPVASCSTCVALFRDCSLAERGKRAPSQFETSAPVIGHLHGVNEESGARQPAVAAAAPSACSVGPLTAPANRRAKSHAVNKTRPLRNWFACHLDDPYPTEEEKAELVQQSGMSWVQVVNWFTNARRRQRRSRSASRRNTYFPQGSPMPHSSFTDMTPMERWRNSPPEEEPATTEAVLAASADIPDFLLVENFFDSSSTHGYGSSLSDDSTSNPYSLHQCGSSSNPPSSHHSFSADSGEFVFKATQAADQPDLKAKGRKVASRDKNKRTYQCTFCRQGFKKKCDWVRHESSIHMLNSESWFCAIPLPPDKAHTTWRIGEAAPECIFCGHRSPDTGHMDSHEFEACAERSIEERAFSRKDHLWQHLCKFHGCRKWEGWSPDISILRQVTDDVQSVCGFCQAIFTSWERRTQHVASHFRCGFTMDQWVSKPGGIAEL
ncbi:hypothetical protein GGR57DRAFT_451888 [Xylariaceae sp. FL1272]|nr:hypothetical protein GGR57DRAFT_451888 [Xylariaceae sp. FL1272]